MQFTTQATLLAVALFAATLICLEVGRRLAARVANDSEQGRAGFGVVEGAVFALLGLLVAFSFSGASSRFDERRKLIVEEVNAVGTAWLRIDLLPPEVQAPMRADFRSYLDARLAIYRAVPDLEKVTADMQRAEALQRKIWSQAVASTSSSPPAATLLLSALNQMFDIASTRMAATLMHPPLVVFILLFGFSLLGALLAGYAMAGATANRWLHSVTFAFALSGAVYVIIDMEYPRLGFIRIHAFDQLLVDLRQSMN